MRVLTENAVLERIGVCRQTLYTWRRKHGFPSPGIIAGADKNFYSEIEVDRWVSENWKRKAI